ncbi:MAG: redoxin domain-containing protein [Maricaulaceae bacterium]|jgi:hypothetical protein
MRRTALLAATALFAVASPAAAYVDNFRLVDQNRRSHELYYYADAPAVVIVTAANGSETSRAAAQALDALEETYAEQGVVFYMLNAELDDDREAVAAEIADLGVDVSVLMDERQLVAEGLGVTRAGEAFLIDPAQGWEVAYHGPVADADNAYLADALAAHLAGEEIASAEVALTTGEEIALPYADAAAHAEISYTDDVAPILMERCASCHAPGGIGPFAMTSYDVVRGYAPMIRETIRTDRMPPYFADPHIGEFKHDAELTLDQARTLVHWIEAGAERGEGDDPLVENVTQLAEWPLGEPDLILEVPAFDIPANGVIEYQYPAVANPLDHEVWLRASTVLPGSREGLHHVLSGYMPQMPDNGIGAQSSWRGSVGSYTPGQEAQVIPTDVGTQIPPGGAIGFQMHYTTFGRAETDVTRVGLYFYDEPPTYIKRSSVIADFTLAIPPGDADHFETAYMDFPRDAILYTIYPHAHYRGSSSELKIRYPDGTEEMLISLPRYDFNWQRDYDLVEPLEIPAGSKLIASWTYDNSERNFANPDPTRMVTWGDQTFAEMAYMRVNYRWVDETVENPIEGLAQFDAVSMIFGAMDDNLSDAIEREELVGPTGQGFLAAFPALDSNHDDAIDREEFAAATSMLNMMMESQLGGETQARSTPAPSDSSDAAGDE